MVRRRGSGLPLTVSVASDVLEGTGATVTRHLPVGALTPLQVGVTQIVLAISYRADVMLEFLREIESLVGCDG